MLESHCCCCPAPVLAHCRDQAGEAKPPLASPLAQTPTHPPELSTAPKPTRQVVVLLSCPVPLPHGGSCGCGAAAAPFSAHCTQPTAAELCVPQWITPVHHELLTTHPFIFFSTIHHFSTNAVSPGLAALFEPYKAGVPEQRLPSPGASTCILPRQAETLGYT